LQTNQDQTLQHLAFEHVIRRQLLLAARVLCTDVHHRAVQLALQDDVLIDDGGDAFQRLLGGGRAGDKKQTGQQTAGEQVTKSAACGAAKRGSDHGNGINQWRDE
jgi:hypothetical protein